MACAFLVVVIKSVFIFSYRLASFGHSARSVAIAYTLWCDRTIASCTVVCVDFPRMACGVVRICLSLFYNACNAEQRLLCFMIGCYIKLQAWMRASMALLDYATAQSFGLRCVALLWTPSVSCTPSRYALCMSERISLLSTFVSLCLPFWSYLTIYPL